MHKRCHNFRNWAQLLLFHSFSRCEIVIVSLWNVSVCVYVWKNPSEYYFPSHNFLLAETRKPNCLHNRSSTHFHPVNTHSESKIVKCAREIWYFPRHEQTHFVKALHSSNVNSFTALLVSSSLSSSLFVVVRRLLLLLLLPGDAWILLPAKKLINA